MKIRVERSVLLDAVLKMQKTVGAKSSMPVLEGILLSAEKGLLTLSSYNKRTKITNIYYCRISFQRSYYNNNQYYHKPFYKQLTIKQLQTQTPTSNVWKQMLKKQYCLHRQINTPFHLSLP